VTVLQREVLKNNFLFLISEPEEKANLGLIIGIVVAGVVIIVLVAVIAVLLLRRRKRHGDGM
jgi:membrane protein DedA with SNARE-associated domain